MYNRTLLVRVEAMQCVCNSQNLNVAETCKKCETIMQHTNGRGLTSVFSRNQTRSLWTSVETLWILNDRKQL